MSAITYKAQSSFGINSNEYNVYSNGKLIGYSPRKNLEGFNPVNNWKSTFSVALQKQLNLN